MEHAPKYVAGLVAGATAVVAVQKLMKMMEKPKKIKIVYFKFGGLGLPIRAACKIGGIEYTNEFVENKDEMTKLKPSLPFGQVPILKLKQDGELMWSQSGAILRYIGKHTGLYPENTYEALKVDELIEGVVDGFAILRPSIRENDESKKKQMRKDIMSGSLPQFLGRLEGVLAKHNGPFAAGKTITIADLSLQAFWRQLTSGIMDGIPSDILKGYPVLLNHAEFMSTLPYWDL